VRFTTATPTDLLRSRSEVQTLRELEIELDAWEIRTISLGRSNRERDSRERGTGRDGEDAPVGDTSG
jgi:hypothetical protein